MTRAMWCCIACAMACRKWSPVGGARRFGPDNGTLSKWRSGGRRSTCFSGTAACSWPTIPGFLPQAAPASGCGARTWPRLTTSALIRRGNARCYPAESKNMEPLPVFRLSRFLAGLSLVACLAFAQTTQPDNPPPTVVTVTAQGMPVSEVPASVTVLSRDYIESSHADNAADLLRAAPFLQIAQTGAGGGLTTVSIRGAQSNFTLVMIDGIPVNDSTNLLGGAFDLTTLPVSNIEQVE